METGTVHVLSWLRLAVEGAGAAVIAYGALGAAVRFVGAAVARAGVPPSIRLDFGRHLALGLEFQLGGDILSTAVAPTWDQIGKLAAVAIVRTALNYFLARELSESP